MHSFFLNHPSPSVLIPALRTVGNIVTGDDMQTQVVIAADIIGPLVHLLQTAEFDIKKEAAWALSSATYGGDPNQIKLKDITLNYPKESGEREPMLPIWQKFSFDLVRRENMYVFHDCASDTGLVLSRGSGEANIWKIWGVALRQEIVILRVLHQETCPCHHLEFRRVWSCLVTKVNEATANIPGWDTF
ncbi:hypothetical protein IFM89_037782 [Coptis chinensis]|uniref:Uncharacterized protein n=1 Tax=Coptis chinensis TaxID=261450 RepID=A0A835LPV4_9MAGN|nr:hypothetical protein IFM89_037782 [Coptis chinensis]